MRKTMKTIGIVIVSILAVGIVIIGGYTIMQKVEYDQMVKIVKSEEVKKIIEEDLTEMDKFALTTKGKIKSYQINYNSIRHNPMGGISFTIYVNNDKDMYVFYTISKDSQTGKLGNDGGGNSAKFEKLITEGKSE
ncbi:hypothetical protein RN88_02210 [Streptococcus intermedius]|uniref:DUF1310 family protein n=1 Tax=Streptococcus intermedius TaxID=1338 RepID=UPI0006CB2D6F|nr:DUF1310 family protein [Streptococcus intermedius]ALF27358.1 hypothetical protein RN88_02210 [Streptococcus intermedius]ARC27253.1 DUF1310 domain-containing protein [Streptococcus intermedius]